MQSAPVHPVSRVLAVLSAATLAVALTGCGFGTAAGPVAHSAGSIQGIAMGGHQPIIGSTVNLYAATTSGYGGAPTLLGTATSGAYGSFSIVRNSNTCTDPDQVYIVASGGNPGAGVNAAAVLLAPLGLCSTVTSSTSVLIDEATTVAAAYALSGFATADGSSTAIATSTTNTIGLANAFANAANLVNLHGDVLATTPTGGTVPAALINSLSNSLSACVNSTAITDPGCSSLAVASPAGVTPTNTWQIALQWAQYPLNNVASAFGNTTAQTNNFYTPVLASQPADLSVAVSYPYAAAKGIAIDASGDVWLSGITGSPLLELGPNGKLDSPATGFGNSAFQALTTIGGVAVDTATSPSVWVASSAGNLYGYNITTGVMTTLTLPTAYYIGGSTTPTTVPVSASSVAIDNANNVWYGTTSSATSLTNVVGEFSAGTTTAVTTWTGSPVLGTTANRGALYLAINPTNNEVVASVNTAKPQFFQAPYTSAITPTTTSAYNASNGVAFSGAAPVIAGAGTTSTGNAKINFFSANPATAPSPAAQFGGTAKSTSFNGVAVDGNNHVFILTAPLTTTNASSLLEFVSPSTFYVAANGLGGFYPVDSTGSTAYLNSTSLKSLEIDQAGATWIAAPDRVMQILGVAAPTYAPLAAGTGGTKP